MLFIEAKALESSAFFGQDIERKIGA